MFGWFAFRLQTSIGNFQALEFVSRYRDTQPQVLENLNKLT